MNGVFSAYESYLRGASTDAFTSLSLSLSVKREQNEIDGYFVSIFNAILLLLPLLLSTLYKVGNNLKRSTVVTRLLAVFDDRRRKKGEKREARSALVTQWREESSLQHRLGLNNNGAVESLTRDRARVVVPFQHRPILHKNTNASASLYRIYIRIPAL